MAYQNGFVTLLQSVSECVYFSLVATRILKRNKCIIYDLMSEDKLKGGATYEDHSSSLLAML